MLVLSRKNGESIVIDGAIKVHVIEVKSNVVRLGIEAPKEVAIHRSELYERIRKNERTFAAPTEKVEQGGRGELHDAVIAHRKGEISDLLVAGADISQSKRQRRVDATPFRRSGASDGNRKNTDGSWGRSGLQR
jgi:carbon storage regulator